MESGQLYSRVARGALLAILFLPLPARARSQQPGAEEWPPISKEEWALNDDPTNPGASAVILFREVSTDDVKSVETHSYRIKILTDEGKKYGDIQIPYLEKLYRIEGIRARTVEPDGTAVEFSGEVFDKLVAKAKKVQFQAKTFTLAGVRPCSIIEYSYQIRWHEKLPDVLKNPANYIITASDAMLTAQWVIPEDLLTQRARFSLRPLPQGRLASETMGLPKDNRPTRQSDGSWLLEVTNVPAFTEEPFMPPERMLKSRVDFFYLIGGGDDPSFFWRNDGKRRASFYEKFIGSSKNIKRVVNETVAPADSPETKLRKLYARAQQIRFVSFEPGKTQKEEKRENLKDNNSAEDVLKHGYAFANEIDLLFVALARAAGFDSAPVRVSARDQAFFQKDSLDRSQLNAMVAWVKVGGKDYYLDPATRFCPYNLLPWNETGAGGIRVEKDFTSFIETPNPRSEDAIVERKASLQLDAEGGLQGTLHVRFTGHEALQRRLENRERDEAGRRKALEDEVKGWLPGGSAVELSSVSKWDEATEFLDADFNLKIANYGGATRRRLLLPLAVFESTAAHAFQNSRRVHPVYFPYPYEELDEVTLQLPADRKVEALPAPRNQATQFGSYKASYESEAQFVKFRRQVVMNGIFFKVEEYPRLRFFFDSVRAGDEEPVVLQKAQ
jgi:hypothetical protein